MINITQALAEAESLQQISDSPQLDVQLLLEQVLEKPGSYLYTWPERKLTEQQQAAFMDMLRRRQAGEPVAHILGYRDFWTLSLAVNATTLIPRPDTERLVELALERVADGPYHVADLGTGTGAIALSLASERPRWMLYATDRLEDAVRLAEQNRQRLNIPNVRLQVGSWCEPLQTLSAEPLDMIVSNPPYIDPADPHLKQGDVRFEPHSALVADHSGMADIELIALQAVDYLKKGGWLLLEHGYDQGERVRDTLIEHSYLEVETFVDLGGQDRVTQGRRPF
ncbi:protein-(glutamine-N5) methyltransferase, release factor-specific [Motiliproteus sp. MSK22-1]|nr:protein-(glutamine-N5) methyltransferase, release factor-specific [Motiliproteus sp. MSK22-1]